MARQLKLVRLTDFSADIDSVDLFADGIMLAVDGYLQAVAPIGANSVHESITLQLTGTSKDDLAAITQDIDAKIKQVQWWLDNPSVERYQVWLRVQLDNESQPRQAMILNIEPASSVRVFNPVEINSNYIGEYQIGITRTPYWEMPYTYPTTTNPDYVSPLGGMTQLKETINGDVPARLARLTISEVTDTFDASDFWIGFKSNRFGDPANFVPVWSLDKGSMVSSSDSSVVADATAYDGNKVRCTFATKPTPYFRCYVRVGNVISNSIYAADQRGDYTVLMRAKMSDTSIALARIAFGFMSDFTKSQSTLTYRNRQTISGSSRWKLYEMGTISIPPMSVNILTPLSNFGISIQAERISGSGSLDMDCLVLIPKSEGSIRVGSEYPATVATNGSQVGIYQNPQDIITAYAHDSASTSVWGPASLSPTNWSLPANSTAPYVVVAADSRITGAADVGFGMTDIKITYNYIPRFRTLRGNVT